jgi:hypothetical protein
MRLKTAITALIACLVLAVPGGALAASPTEDAYSGVLPAQANGDNGSSNTPNSGTEAVAAVEEAPVSPAAVESVSGGDTLPFTGLEVGIIALVGVMLIGGGVVLYRFTRTATPRSS